jgi:hypothetical protein
MKLNQVTIKVHKNLGNYESVELQLTSELQQGDNASQVIDDVSTYINYKLNYESRKSQYDNYLKELENDLPEKDRKKYQSFVDKFEELEKQVSEFKFINVE